LFGLLRSPHGVKYVVECSLETPDRRNPCLRSVWIIETGQDCPGWSLPTDPVGPVAAEPTACHA
jgi:hypothetical protein